MKQMDIVSKSVEMHQNLTESSYELAELRRIFAATSVADYFKHDSSLGGYVPHKRRLKKKNYFV